MDVREQVLQHLNSYEIEPDMGYYLFYCFCTEVHSVLRISGKNFIYVYDYVVLIHESVVNA